MIDDRAPEYLIITAMNLTDLEAKLNEAAEDGWRLVTTDIRPPSYIATLERE